MKEQQPWDTYPTLGVQFEGKIYPSNTRLWKPEQWKRVKTNWNWRNTPERTGYQVGTCGPIGPEDKAKGAEYVPVKFDGHTFLTFLHISKLLGIK